MNFNNNDFRSDNKFYTEEDMKKDKDAYVCKEKNIVSLPNLNELTKDTYEILFYIESDKMKKLEDKNPEDFKKELEEKFPNYVIKYTHTFEKLCDKENREENVKKLLELFENMRNVKNGKANFDSVSYNVKEELNEKYVYPKHGGKKNFEKNMRKKN